FDADVPWYGGRCNWPNTANFRNITEYSPGLPHPHVPRMFTELRREIWTDIINPMSRENFRRLVDRDSNTARETDGFSRAFVEAEWDEGLARELAMVSI